MLQEGQKRPAAHFIDLAALALHPIIRKVAPIGQIGLTKAGDIGRHGVAVIEQVEVIAALLAIGQ